MSRFESSKQRTVRIPLDYYKRLDRLTRWGLILSGVAVVAAIWWASGLGWDVRNWSRWSERSRELATHGAVARVHAPWDNQCEACHVPFTPIGQNKWTASFVGGSAQSDAKCQSCHAGPRHHADQNPEDKDALIACAGCHHDHRGRDASLVRIADHHCTQCHSDLTAGHVKPGYTPEVAVKVTRFDADPEHHPEFRASRERDPGRLKFNHARHMIKGIASPDGGSVWTHDQFAAPADKKRYQNYADAVSKEITLDCAACHRLDAEEPGTAPAISHGSPERPGPVRAAGRLYLPVTFENDCRACHTLDFDPASPDLVMDHRIQPGAVHKALWRIYAEEYVTQNPALLDRYDPAMKTWKVPGRVESDEEKKARAAVERKVRNAEKILFGAKKCGECHEYESQGQIFTQINLDDGNLEEVKVRSVNIPEVWFFHSEFDHSAHRAVDCKQCHERAYPDAANSSTSSQDVLLPSIKTCTECHAPRGRGSAARTVVGGASFDCTECHRYHNGDAPLQGPGASANTPESAMTIRQFLLGNPSAPQ
ncbi:MAG: hypothetical protein JO034_08355 [Singulisphaera sp.]|nr:hypothetical protein [Singulisphaera sp.]